MYSTMMRRLEAEETLDSIYAALASGNRALEDHGRATYMNQLERRAAGVTSVRRATRSSMASMGVEVIIEKDDEKKGGEQ
jgi:hypothetical protein